jgi:hypothetical protein
MESAVALTKSLERIDTIKGKVGRIIADLDEEREQVVEMFDKVTKCLVKAKAKLQTHANTPPSCRCASTKRPSGKINNDAGRPALP